MNSDFKAHSIRRRSPKPPKPPKEKKPLSVEAKQKILTLCVSVIVAFALIFGIGIFIKNLNVTDLVKGLFFEFGSELNHTNNQTNILMVGTGGEGHSGKDLTDTIIVASIDHESNLVPMISIPRDLFVETEYGNFRINHLYDMIKSEYEEEGLLEPGERALQKYKATIEDIIGVPIHYYVKVDFQGFEDIVNALDGVDIYVEKAIYDPYYPKDGTIYYDPFKIEKGQQSIDGETALKYARSRKTTSDFDRAKRQQQLLFAIKDRAMDLEIVTSPNKIKNLYYSLQKNIETNLKITEMIELGRISENIDSTKIISNVISNDPYSSGGFLYTPDREQYGGAYVLVPYNNFESIHLYTQIHLLNPEISQEEKTIRILNGTKTTGLAAQTYYLLARFGFLAESTGNADSKDKLTTKIYLKNPDDYESKTVQFLINEFVEAKIENNLPVDFLNYEEDIIIELGSDYLEKRRDDLII